jgi:hypothetical protein
MLLAVSPALERVLGPRLDDPVGRALPQRYPTPPACSSTPKQPPVGAVAAWFAQWGWAFVRGP